MWTSFPESTSKTHFNPNKWCSTNHTQSAKMCFCQAATADDQEDRAPGSRGDSAEDITARKATALFRAHTLVDTQTHRETGGRQQSPCHFQLEPAHVLSCDTLHTAQWASAPLVPHCRHRETAKELLQLCRTNTEISLPAKHVILPEIS